MPSGRCARIRHKGIGGVCDRKNLGVIGQIPDGDHVGGVYDLGLSDFQEPGASGFRKFGPARTEVQSGWQHTASVCIIAITIIGEGEVRFRVWRWVRGTAEDGLVAGNVLTGAWDGLQNLTRSFDRRQGVSGERYPVRSLTGQTTQPALKRTLKNVVDPTLRVAHWLAKANRPHRGRKTRCVPIASRPVIVAWRNPRGTRCGFALVEVILAIGIATGLLLIALVFYHQAAGLREQILQESQRASEMRLALDRLAGDLRTAQPHARPGEEFVGDSDSVRFTRQALATPLASAFLLTNQASSDLARISLFTVYVTNGSTSMVASLSRLEEPSVAKAQDLASLASLSSDAPPSDAPSAGQTNSLAEPLAEHVRFVRFRYWNGLAWQAAWSNAAPPPGVEIVLAAEALPQDATPDDYPPDPFRRVVFLPGGTALPAQAAAPPDNSIFP